MDFRKVLFNKKIIIGILVLIPVLMILLVILCRDVITPSNEDIISELKDTKYYSSKVDYLFKNSKSEFEENTMQYYSFDKGSE